MKKIIWFCGPLEYKNTGVGRYSSTYIMHLKKHGFNIIDKRIKTTNPILRTLSQFLLNPLKIILFYRNKQKVFRDEGMLLYTLFPFFPYKNTIYIIHDIRDFKLSADKQNFLQKIYFYLIKKSYKNLKHISTIITPSQFTKNTIMKQFNISENNIHIIYNPFDFNVFQRNETIGLKNALLKKYNIKSNKKIILNVGSEETRKNIITILRSMKELNNYLFIKIGKPVIQKNRNEHLKYINENNLQNRVFFIDYIEDTTDLVNFYSIVDVFLFPSLFEGFGRPPIEAQACGCPVISSDRGGLKEVIGDSCIILQDPQDSGEVVQIINNLDGMQTKNLISLGYENVKRFSIYNNINLFISLLKK